MPSVVRTGELPKGPVDRFESEDSSRESERANSARREIKNDPVSRSQPEG
jgi:hypothetical protein